MSWATNYLVVSTDFGSAAIGSASVDASGALPGVPLLRVPLLKGSLFHASGIAYTFDHDASGAFAGFAATVSNVTPSAVVQAHVSARVGGGFSAWTNGLAAGNVLDLSFNFRSRWTRLRFDVANAGALVGTASVGDHIALMTTNVLLMRKPASAVDALGAPAVSALATAINAQVAARIGAVLASQPVQDAILKALVAANGPVIDPLAARLPYDASYSDLDLVLYLRNFGCSASFPGQLPQTISFDRLPILLSISSA